MLVIVVSLYRWQMSGFETTVLLLFGILISMVARIPIPTIPKRKWKDRLADFNKGFKEFRGSKLSKESQ